MRAQLNTLQQQVMSNSYTGFPVGVSNEHILAMEKEVENLQAQLKVGHFVLLQCYACPYY